MTMRSELCRLQVGPVRPLVNGVRPTVPLDPHGGEPPLVIRTCRALHLMPVVVCHTGWLDEPHPCC